MTNSRLGTEILVPSPPRYTNNLASTKDRAGQSERSIFVVTYWLINDYVNNINSSQLLRKQLPPGPVAAREAPAGNSNIGPMNGCCNRRICHRNERNSEMRNSNVV